MLKTISPSQKSSKPSKLVQALRIAMIAVPLLSSMAMPKGAFASSSNQTETYNYLFNNFKEGVNTYYIFAGNVGDATQLNTFSTGNASVNNNTLYVYSGAGIDSTNQDLIAGDYPINGAAGYIALNGNINTVTATGNTAIMDTSSYELGTEGTTETGVPTYMTATNYISDLTGAYININDYSYKITDGDIYIQTTVDTLTASNNSVILKNGVVGLTYDASTDVFTESGNYLAGVVINSMNNNGDAQFNLYNNSVLIEGGFVTSSINDLAGAQVSAVTGNATMSGNSVTITGGEVNATTIAGAVFYSNTLDNRQSIFGEFTNDNGTTGFYSIKELYNIGGFTNINSTATMFNNSVTIANAGVDFTASTISGAYSAATSASTLYNNSVTISGGDFVSNHITTTTNDGDYIFYTPLYITGAYIEPAQWKEVDVEASSGQGDLVTPAGTIVNMKAYDNSVTITGGTFYGTITGAAIVASGTSDITYNGSISNNTVNIYGGSIELRNEGTFVADYNGIYGGVYLGMENDNIVHNYSVTNNTVNIGFDATVDSNVNIGGGAYSVYKNADSLYFDLTPNVNTYDGNTLNLYHLTGSTVKAYTVANFENINFVLGADDSSQFDSATGGAILEATTLYLGNGTGNEATKYTNFGLHTSLYNTLTTGETITLMKLVDGTDSDGATVTTASIDGYFTNLGEDNSGTYTGTKGAFLGQTWNIQTSNGEMTATLLSTQAGEQAKVLGEVSLGGMAAINAGADLAAGSAMSAAKKKVQSQQDSNNGDARPVGFMASSAGSSRTYTGSHVDSDTISLNAGVAYGGTGNNGDWLLGTFLEYTHGDYSTYNSFSSGSVNGEGGVEAFGIGGFARFDFDVKSDFAWGMKPYVEASLRLGCVETDFATGDLQDYSVEDFTSAVAYDVHHTYMGAHLGFGGVYEVTDKHTVDTSLRYFWTHQFHDNENILGHDIEYHAIDSHRVRLNGRSTHTLQSFEEFGTFNVYGGLGLEYEFDGEARTTVDGYAADAPDLQGFTGLCELGFSFTPIDKQPLTVDLGLQGYMGKREGIGGSLQLMYGF